MKKFYNKPVLEFESFLTEEILVEGAYKEQNVLSYNSTDPNYGGYGTPNSAGFINFADGSDNLLNSVNYNDFTN